MKSMNRYAPQTMKSRRDGYKWSHSEVLALQREFHLLKLSINVIAKKHERSNLSITFKLEEIKKDLIIEETLEKYAHTVFKGKEIVLL